MKYVILIFAVITIIIKYAYGSEINVNKSNKTKEQVTQEEGHF